MNIEEREEKKKRSISLWGKVHVIEVVNLSSPNKALVHVCLRPWEIQIRKAKAVLWTCMKSHLCMQFSLLPPKFGHTNVPCTCVVVCAWRFNVTTHSTDTESNFYLWDLKNCRMLRVCHLLSSRGFILPDAEINFWFVRLEWRNIIYVVDQIWLEKSFDEDDDGVY